MNMKPTRSGSHMTTVSPDHRTSDHGLLTTSRFSRENRKCLVTGIFAGRIVTSSTPYKVSSRLRCQKSQGDGYDVDTSDSESQGESADPKILNVHKKRRSIKKNRQSQSKLRIKGSLAKFFTKIKSCFNQKQFQQRRSTDLHINIFDVTQ